VTFDTVDGAQINRSKHDPDGEWPRRWQQFLAAGGITSKELAKFMVDAAS
jgi:hypothetical protein